MHDNVDHSVSLYAATKKANELMAHANSLLLVLPTTSPRVFTVCGHWGQLYMALFLILEGRPADISNHGRMCRDFTDIDERGFDSSIGRRRTPPTTHLTPFQLRATSPIGCSTSTTINWWN